MLGKNQGYKHQMSYIFSILILVLAAAFGLSMDNVLLLAIALGVVSIIIEHLLSK